MVLNKTTAGLVRCSIRLGCQTTAIGSSIARIIVESHGGTIRLMDKAESGHSTMFEIVF